MEVAAKLRAARISAQKARLVADQVRGKPVEEALNVLEFSTLRTIAAAFLLLNSSTFSASSTGLPRTWSATRRAFCAEMRAARNLAATSISLSSRPYRLAFLSTM